jgi:DNA polymerase
MFLPAGCSDAAALQELHSHIRAGGLVEAHNVWFEFCIWRNTLLPRQEGWPDIPLDQWRCSAAKAATHALPRGLDKAAAALRIRHQKDVEGSKLMKKMTKPRRSKVAERKVWDALGVEHPRVLWHDSPEMLARLIEYCKQDVLAEESLSNRLPDLSPDETKLFQLDLAINLRGFQIDRTAVKMALQLVHRETVLFNQELSTITEGAIKKFSQRKRVLAWLEAQDFWLPNTQGGTLDECLAFLTLNGSVTSTSVARVIAIVRTLGRSSTAKYVSMKRWWDQRDGRVRGGLLYHGASTGRWSGKGIQPHNFPKGVLKGEIGEDGDYLRGDDGKVSKVEMARLWAAIKGGKRDDLISRFGGVMESLSTALRGAIVAGHGRKLFVADYSSIEARVLLWLAGDDAALAMFRRDEDIYVDMARSIRPDADRALGKVAILGLGYGMGADKFYATCLAWNIPITEELAQETVDAYRTKYWRVKQLWRDVEAAAIEAVQTRKPVNVACVTFYTFGSFLYCRLPSGRLLAYAYPEVREKMTSWGQMRTALTFMGVDPKTHQWRRQSSYGGLTVENIVQAISRDLMARGMLRCEESGYPVILSVHDEVLSEAADGDLAEFVALLTELPDWAYGCPIAAEGWVGVRYRK